MIHIKRLHKKYKNHVILDDIHLEVKAGEIVSLTGPSGQGKTTLLRCIQGLETYEGEIIRKGIAGFVFQHFYLFPHLTVLDNITYALIYVKHIPHELASVEAFRLLKHLHLQDKAGVYPHSLSGGQKQRVALIRAIVMEPDILLLDEPTSALDPDTKEIVIELLKKYQNGKRAIIFISHDVEFGKKLATRQLLLKNGSLISG